MDGKWADGGEHHDNPKSVWSVIVGESKCISGYVYSIAISIDCHRLSDR